MKKLRFYIDGFSFVLGIFKMVMNPKDISAIFKVKAFREHKSLKIALDLLKNNPSTNELMTTRYLAPEPYKLEELLKLPENTLGRVYAEHMKHYKLDVVFYPEMDSKLDDDINYMRMRARQTHDIHHVVLGFPAEDYGEVAISAFYLSQNKIPLSGLIIGSAFFRVILKEPDRVEQLMDCIIKGWSMGKKAQYVLGIKWERYFNTDINEVRQIVGIDKSLMLGSDSVKEVSMTEKYTKNLSLKN